MYVHCSAFHNYEKCQVHAKTYIHTYIHTYIQAVRSTKVSGKCGATQKRVQFVNERRESKKNVKRRILSLPPFETQKKCITLYGVRTYV
jgi:hypothetical protein